MSGKRAKIGHFPYRKQNSIAEIVSTMEFFWLRRGDLNHTVLTYSLRRIGLRSPRSSDSRTWAVIHYRSAVRFALYLRVIRPRAHNTSLVCSIPLSQPKQKGHRSVSFALCTGSPSNTIAKRTSKLCIFEPHFVLFSEPFLMFGTSVHNRLYTTA